MTVIPTHLLLGYFQPGGRISLDDSRQGVRLPTTDDRRRGDRPFTYRLRFIDTLV